MPFEKGRTKTGGRKAGTPNQAVNQLRDQLQTIVQTSLAELPTTLAAMEPTERAKALTALLPYVMPKLSSIDLSTPADLPSKSRPDWLSTAGENPIIEPVSTDL